MVELNSTYVGWKSGLSTFTVVVAATCGLVFNILFIFVFLKSKYMRRPPHLFLLNLAIADILGAVFWAYPSVAASAKWSWSLGDGYCEAQGFFANLSYALNVYTLTVIAFEKFLRIVMPSKHEDAFHNYTITVIVIGSLWLLSFVIALLPLVGWGSFRFYSYQMQCAQDYVIASTHLSFHFVTTLVFPTIAALVLYIMLFIKVKALNNDKNLTKDGKLVLETRKGASGESFAQKMKTMQAKFKVNQQTSVPKTLKKKSKKKPSKPKSEGNTDEGYISDDKCFHSDDSDLDISEDEYYNDYEEYRIKKHERERRRQRKKVYTYKRQYLLMAITMLIITVIYVALWLPYFFVSYNWVYDPTSVKEASYTLFTLLTFFGISYKPLLYLTNQYMRFAMRKAFTCKRKKQVEVTGEARETTVYESTTVHEVHHTEEVEETTITTKTYEEEEKPQPSVAWENFES